MPSNVPFGSKADVKPRTTNVRFVPIADICFEGETLTEDWVEYDRYNLFRQLGAL